ncbi:MAG: hypothetical protein IKW58_02160 [Alphaproteobacteria bacterium]|nr:hypothetical protein [Alphaproteobacteria bacterium]
MKKILFFAIALSLAVGAYFVLFNNSKSNTASFENFSLNEQLISYNEGTRIGVKQKATGEIILHAGDYKSFEVDSFIIKAICQNNRILVFNHQGTPIGGMSFDTFIDIKTEDNANTYYLGTSHFQKYYYFPKTKSFVVPVRVFQTPTVLCLLDMHKISFFDSQANRLWRINAKDVVLLKDKQGTNSTFYVVKKDINTHGYIIYNIDGTERKRISSTRWKLLLSKEITNLSDINNIKYGEIEEL